MKSTFSMGLIFVIASLLPLQAEEVLLARMAVLVSGDDSLVASPVFSNDRWIEELLDWDPERDRPELEQLLGIPISGELLRQAVELPLEGGDVLAGVDFEDSWIEARATIGPPRNGEFICEAIIRRDGEVISAPRILGALGERAIVSTRDSNGFLFFVLELERVSVEAARKQEESWGWEGVDRVEPGRIEAPRAHADREPPKYPEEARKAKIQAKVVLRTLIDIEGRVSQVNVVRGASHGLSEAAMDAVRSWRFDPATDAGKPVPVIYHLTVNFRLDGGDQTSEPKTPVGPS